MPKLKNLVISGGGIYGISFLGVLKHLDKFNLLDDIQCYYGTSVGSIICFLLIIGYKYNELFDFCQSFDLEKLVNNPNIDNFIESFGFESSNKMLYVIKRLIENKSYSDEITFKELYELKGKKLNITGVCLNDNNVYIFNNETTPDMKILIAIKISCNIPVLFSPIKYDNKLWIDGGAIMNYPIDLCRSEIEETLGISFYDDNFVKTEDITDILTYMSGLVKSIAYGNSKLTIHKYKNNTIKLKHNSSLFIDFKISKDNMVDLFNDGYDAVISQHYIIQRFITEENECINCKLENLNDASDDSDNISLDDIDFN